MRFDPWAHNQYCFYNFCAIQILIEQTELSRDLAKKLLIFKKGDIVESILEYEKLGSSDKLNKLLTQNGYILVKKILLDYIYVNKDFSLNKIKYVKPPKRKF